MGCSPYADLREQDGARKEKMRTKPGRAFNHKDTKDTKTSEIKTPSLRSSCLCGLPRLYSLDAKPRSHRSYRVVPNRAFPSGTRLRCFNGMPK
jgi:hypothetical protein